MWIIGYFTGLLLGNYFLADHMLGTGPGAFPQAAMASMAGPFWYGLQYTAGLAGLLCIVRSLGRFLTTVIRQKGQEGGFPPAARPSKACSAPGLSLALLVLGWAVQWLSLVFTATPLLNCLGQDVAIRGTIGEEPRVGREWAAYQVSVQEYLQPGKGWQRTRGKVIVQVNKPGQFWEFGDAVEFAGKLDRPPAANNPGQFNYRRYLANRGIYLTLKVLPGQQGTRLSRTKGNLVKGVALAVRDKLANTGTVLFPGQEGQLLNGMVLGAGGDLDPQLRETFNTTGLSHLLSVSGFHVALVAALPILLGRALAWSPLITFGITTAVVFGYSLVSGLSAPVVRAGVMIILGLFALLFKQRKHWPTILAAAALLTTLPYPRVVTEPGYQLSFSATWAILALTPVLQKAFNHLSPALPEPVKAMLAVPLAAQLGTWPLVAFHFNQISLIGIFANLLLVDLAGLILILGLVVAVTGVFFLDLAGIFQFGLAMLLKLFIWSANFLAGLPGASFNTISPPLFLLTAYYGLLWLIGDGDRRNGILRFWQVCLFKQPQLRSVLSGRTATLTGLVLTTVLLWSWPGLGTLQVTFLDVGAGDSIFIRTPEGHTMLVDTGRIQMDAEGEVIYDAGKKVVLPYLRSQGINKLDLLVLTHPHSDHIGGAEAILHQLRVGKVLVSPVRGEGTIYSRVLSKIAANQIPLEQGRAGQEILLDQEVKLEILGPVEETLGPLLEQTPGPTPEFAVEKVPETSINNQSLVIKLNYASHSFLFTGDLEQEGMKAILALTAGEEAETGSLLQSTILKVPHHGSRTGYYPEFYRQVQPKVAVIPVGPNFFGHPHSQVVDYFREKDIPIFRTDEWGAITFRSDGKKLVVQTYGQGVGFD